MAFELNTRALRYFAAVAKHKSYTLASTHLRVTQPAITRQIQGIERAFGVRLFRRQGREMALTEAGEALLEQAIDIIERVDATGTLVKQAAGEPTGRVAVGAPIATGELLLPSILARYRMKYPRVFVHVVTGYTGDLVAMLADGRLDLAMIFGEPSHGDLDVQPLLDMDLGLVAPASGILKGGARAARKIELADAVTLPLIFPSQSQTLRAVVDQACRRIGATPNVVMESDSLGISKELVKAGVGCMFIGAIGVAREVAAGELRWIALKPPKIVWRLSLATRKSKSISLAARMLMREIVDSTATGSIALEDL